MQTAGRMQQNDYSDAFSVEPHQGCLCCRGRLRVCNATYFIVPAIDLWSRHCCTRATSSQGSL